MTIWARFKNVGRSRARGHQCFPAKVWKAFKIKYFFSIKSLMVTEVFKTINILSSNFKLDKKMPLMIHLAIPQKLFYTNVFHIINTLAEH